MHGIYIIFYKKQWRRFCWAICLVCGRVWFWCCTSADAEVPGIHHRRMNTRGGDYQSRTLHSIYNILCFTLSIPIHSSFGYLRAATASMQAASSSRNSIQFTHSILSSGTQQHTEEFPFAFTDEYDMAQQYIVGVSYYVFEDHHDTSSFHSSFCFCDNFCCSFRLVLTRQNSD
jgi:hypothetical protein